MRDPRWAQEEGKFNDFHGYLYTVNNGTMDVEGFLDSEYGRELADRLEVRFRIEEDPKAAEEYYAGIGLRKEYHNYGGDYYDRWTLLVPADIAQDERLAVIFWLHGGGNSIEAEENMTGYAQLAARERFLLVCPQNTNPESVLAILEELSSRYPVDSGRVYLSGFSQGGAQTHGLYMRHPEKIAAVVTSGDHIWRPWDNFGVNYTEEEIARVKALRVPLMQFCGQCEPFSYAPLNAYSPRFSLKNRPWGTPDTFSGKNTDFDRDPTRIHDLSIGKFDPVFGDKDKAKWHMAPAYVPQEGEDPGRWNLNRVNKRMELLNCEPRDVERCLGFASLHQHDVHRVTGIYGDYEAVEYHYGYRHNTVGICDREGHEVYRFVTVQNSPHWPQLAMGELGWNFMKRFRRDETTGELKICG